MRRIMSTAAVVTLLASIGLAGYGWAASSDDVIHGCVGTKTGVLRVVSATATCLRTETPLEWNKTGPAGDAGNDGTSATTTALSVGDTDCPTGGIAVDSASPTTYVCNGADGAEATLSFDDLQGSACRIGDPLVGTIDVDYGPDGGVGFTCVATATHSLAVTRTGSGSGTVTSAPDGIDCPGTCTEDFPATSTVVLSATPDTDHVFTGWSGDCTGVQPTCTLAMTSDRDVTANFRLLYSLTIHIDGQIVICVFNDCVYDGGSVSYTDADTDEFIGFCSRTTYNPELDYPPCVRDYDTGRHLTLTANPESGVTFTGWSGDCSGTGSCAITMDSDHVVHAGFQSTD